MSKTLSCGVVLLIICLSPVVNAQEHHPRFDTIRERIASRTYPSIFDTWCDMGGCSYIDGTRNVNERRAMFDLSYAYEWVQWDESVSRPVLTRTPHRILPYSPAVNRMNPNKLYLAEVRFANTSRNWNYFPADSDYWIRDANGKPVPLGHNSPWYLIDFTHPEVQNIIIQQAVDIAETGKYDGVFFDYFQDERDVLRGHRSIAQQQEARLAIMRGIRERTHPDFLILGNVNANKLPLSAPYVNGAMMENPINVSPVHDMRRTQDFLGRIESTLIWSEHNLREPRINCLWIGIHGRKLEKHHIQQWLRLVTTLSLTTSDGYVSFFNAHGRSGHRYEWYDFWDANLGQPVGEKGVQHNNEVGVYIREFDNGWAVYNRSPDMQAIVLPEVSVAVSTGKQDFIHEVPPMDGDIFLYRGNVTPVDRRGLLTTSWGSFKTPLRQQ